MYFVRYFIPTRYYLTLLMRAPISIQLLSQMCDLRYLRFKDTYFDTRNQKKEILSAVMQKFFELRIIKALKSHSERHPSIGFQYIKTYNA